MTTKDLVAVLKRLKVETGSIACLGCGHEHGCSVHGCAIIREAVDKLEDMTDRCARYAEEAMVARDALRWRSVADELPNNTDLVLGVVNGEVGSCTYTDALCLVRYDAEDKLWWLDDVDFGYGDAISVSHWMLLPPSPLEVEV